MVAMFDCALTNIDSEIFDIVTHRQHSTTWLLRGIAMISYDIVWLTSYRLICITKSISCDVTWLHRRIGRRLSCWFSVCLRWFRERLRATLRPAAGTTADVTEKDVHVHGCYGPVWQILHMHIRRQWIAPVLLLNENLYRRMYWGY